MALVVIWEGASRTFTVEVARDGYYNYKKGWNRSETRRF